MVRGGDLTSFYTVLHTGNILYKIIVRSNFFILVSFLRSKGQAARRWLLMCSTNFTRRFYVFSSVARAINTVQTGMILYACQVPSCWL